MRRQVRIQTEDFDVAAEWRACRARCGGAAGALAAFAGLVRDHAPAAGEGPAVERDEDESAVRGLRLEHYAGMTEASIERIVDEAAERWRLLDVTVIHRVGELRPEAQIVLVLVASGHRADAFAACEFVMDYLKTDAVLWKKERRANGDAWVQATAGDQRRRAAW